MESKINLNYTELVSQGLDYTSFLNQYATPEQRQRWVRFYELVTLSETQQELLRSFVREMKVLVLAGAWCGDCVNQCPIFAKFAELNPNIKLLFFDRDDHPDFAGEMSVCGGERVPAVLFLNEDDQPCGRYGDRTISKYRQMISDMTGAACPTGLVAPEENLIRDVIADWFVEFERNQYIMRTSPRLRKKHGD
ncbi:MAG: thioredoxin family protein [Planctomycetaceae bacterium]|nr:thioredoxin family protein [Planctomycetaceae bacterium]